MRLTASLFAAASLIALGACQPADDASTPPGAETPAVDTPAVEEPATPADPNALTSEGWSTLRIGMTLAEVTAAMGPDSNPDAVGGPDPESCDQFRPERAPEGLLVMMEDGVLTSISIGEPSTLTTDRGFGVGSSPAEIKAAYGDAATSSPHNYVDAPGEYITVWDGGPRGDAYVQDEAARGVVYEVNQDGVVSYVRVGGPSIQYVEGCA